MPEFERGFDAQQEEILSRNPLLKAFFDKSAESDPQMWAQMLATELIPVVKEMQGKFGPKNLLSLGIWPQLNSCDQVGIFENTLDYKDKLSSVTLVLAMGYEIGNMPEASRFTQEIILRLILTHTMKLPSSDEDMVRLNDHVWPLLSTGCYWKSIPGTEAKIQPPDIADSDVPDVFKDFFDKNGKLDNL